jgi:hypothetical protein
LHWSMGSWESVRPPEIAGADSQDRMDQAKEADDQRLMKD